MSKEEKYYVVFHEECVVAVTTDKQYFKEYKKLHDKFSPKLLTYKKYKESEIPGDIYDQVTTTNTLEEIIETYGLYISQSDEMALQEAYECCIGTIKLEFEYLMFYLNYFNYTPEEYSKMESGIKEINSLIEEINSLEENSEYGYEPFDVRAIGIDLLVNETI